MQDEAGKRQGSLFKEQFSAETLTMRYVQNHHFMVPGSHFRLLQGEDKLTSYQVQIGYVHCVTAGQA